MEVINERKEAAEPQGRCRDRGAGVRVPTLSHIRCVVLDMSPNRIQLWILFPVG